MSEIRFLFILPLVGMLFFAGCGTEEVEKEAALNLPPREHTWVRTETVRKTTDGLREAEALPDIPINQALAAKLTRVKKISAENRVTDSTSCLVAMAPLDKRRTAVQKAGGMWHAYERLPDARPYTNNGMQLDSQMNTMVFALRHLCTTAKGVPMDELARRMSKKIKARGKEATREELTELGVSPEDVDIWLIHAEFASKNAGRVVEYSAIEELIARAESMADVYEDLFQRQVKADGVNLFLSDTATLLKALQEFLSSDRHMVMALKEDTEPPFAENWDM